MFDNINYIFNHTILYFFNIIICKKYKKIKKDDKILIYHNKKEIKIVYIIEYDDTHFIYALEPPNEKHRYKYTRGWEKFITKI